MALFGQAAYPTQGAYLKIGADIILGTTSIPGFGGGEATEIDITPLNTPGGTRQYALGFRDLGSITVPLVSTPQSAVAKTLREAAKARTENSFTLRYGGKLNAATGLVGDEAAEITGNLGDFTAAAPNGDDEVAITLNGTLSSLPPVAVGDFIQQGATQKEVIRVVQGTGGDANKGIVWIDTDAALDAYAAANSATHLKLLRPGVKIEFTGLVRSYSLDLGVEEVARHSVTIRVTGDATETFGNPDL